MGQTSHQLHHPNEYCRDEATGAIESPVTDEGGTLAAALPEIYAAASQPRRWQAVLQRLLAQTGSRCGALLGVPTDAGNRSHCAVGMGAELLQALAPPDGLSACLTRKPGYSGLLSAWAETLVEPDLVRLQRAVGRYGAGDCWIADLGYGAALSLHAPGFNAATQAHLHSWLTHLRAAIKLAWQLASAQRQNRSLFGLLGGLGYGALLLDSEGHFLEANSRGVSLLQAGQSLYLHGKELMARCEASNQQLHECLTAVVHGKAARASAQLQDACGRLDVLCMPYAETPGLLALANPSEPQFVVFVTEREAAANLSVESLAQTYGLSPTEAELMHLLANDYELGEVAAARGTSINTVRSQLAALREKTGASRQTALVRLALMSPARLASSACHAG